MTNRLDFNSNLVRRGIEELPREVSSILDRIMRECQENVTNRKAPDDFEDFFGSEFNLIPSKHKGVCHHLLVGICYDRDNFEERIRACLDHAASDCKGINKEIYFISTQWNSFTIDKFKGYLESLRGNGLLIQMIHITSKSFVLMPV